MTRYASWGLYPRLPQTAVQPRFADALAPLLTGVGALPFGNGRSYGDSCLASGGPLIDMQALNRVRSFDRASGRIVCEAGLLLHELIALALPLGWFPPVTPGTSFVTVGGAIANDVHGKNHHATGSFGHHVRWFDLLRSDGQVLRCSPEQHADWFAATIGGLGLTGLIGAVELQLRPVQGPWLQTESIKFGNLGEFFALSQQSAADWEYTVAWTDCLARGPQLGRGHFLRANHAGPLAQGRLPGSHARQMPFTPPFSLVNRWSLGAFNTLYYHRQRQHSCAGVQHYRPYFYPLDAIQHWNRLYGRQGFQQYQCVLPPAQAEAACSALLRTIATSGEGSFLAVLKQFGDHAAPGWLSFARPGTTLALDFAQRGEATRSLFERLDQIVLEAGGAIYPAKDAHMPAKLFRLAYPRWQELEARRDPALCSAFWRRVALDPATN